MLPLVAEFLGTTVFLSSILLSGGNAWVIGATLIAVILAIGGISGGHVNPAVSFAFLLKGTIGQSKFIGYVAAQLLGAAAAYFIYRNVNK